MAFDRKQLRKTVQGLVKLDADLADDQDYEDGIDAAIDYHSRVRKYIQVVEVTASGNRTYALPTGWQVGFSEAGFQIEYPVDSEAGWPTYLPSSMVGMYNTPTGQQIRFRETQLSNRLPAKDDKFRVHFQIKYVVGEAKADTTVPDADYFPLAYLVTSQLCLIAANKLAQNVDSSLQADTANYRDKDDKFTRLSKEWMARYKQSVMPPSDELKAAGQYAEFEQDDFDRTQLPFFWRDDSSLKNTDR